MKAYRITEGQKNALLNQRFGTVSIFNPVQDINGVWFIFQPEYDFIIQNFGFVPVEAEFIPPPDPILQMEKSEENPINKK